MSINIKEIMDNISNIKANENVLIFQKRSSSIIVFDKISATMTVFYIRNNGLIIEGYKGNESDFSISDMATVINVLQKVPYFSWEINNEKQFIEFYRAIVTGKAVPSKCLRGADAESISNLNNDSKRKSWDKYFMDIAEKVAERSTCPRLHVGAVLVKDKRIKATGYNGSPKGLPHCEDVGCYMENNHCTRTIHAELNAILEAPPEERKGATIYVTHMPCPECQKVIISNGITRVVYKNEYKPSHNWFEQTPWIKVEHLE